MVIRAARVVAGYDPTVKTKTNPVFYRDQLELLLDGEEDRLQRMVSDPASVDLLTWNVFTSLDTHSDRDYLAYRLQALGGAQLTAPTRTALWTGRRREPLLAPNPGYLALVNERAAGAGGGAAAVEHFRRPVEVPVRIESPDVLALVDTMGDAYPLGTGGRDRLVELIDVGLDQARRLSKNVAVAVVYESGTAAAQGVSARMQQLRDPGTLARELPYRNPLPPVVLREVPWQQLLRIWEQETPFLRLSGQPVRGFVDHLRRRGMI